MSQRFLHSGFLTLLFPSFLTVAFHYCHSFILFFLSFFISRLDDLSHSFFSQCLTSLSAVFHNRSPTRATQPLNNCITTHSFNQPNHKPSIPHLMACGERFLSQIRLLSPFVLLFLFKFQRENKERNPSSISYDQGSPPPNSLELHFHFPLVSYFFRLPYHLAPFISLPLISNF